MTILLFVVLLYGICFIERYTLCFFFCAIFDLDIGMKTKQIRKKVLPAYPVGEMLNFPLREAKSQWVDVN